MMTRGSEWQRWDLHVHTPETILNNQFGDWDEYLKIIESHPSVKVIGVTDYMTITNYSKLKSYKEQGRIANIDLLIPNIEFRIAPPTEKATSINIHLLISPDDPDHERKINEAFGRLEWTYKNERYSCIPDQLTALGKAFDETITGNRAALEEGIKQFKVGFDNLKEWVENEPWIRRNSIVAVAAGDDGLSGFRLDGAWGALREEITRFSQVMFSGRPGERQFWLGKRGAKDVEAMRSLGGPKPCVHGSDAHSIDKLFKPAKNRYCWIKADPTFEGLRQILYEPEDRVHIGPTSPEYHDKNRVIRNVHLTSADGWLDDIEIPLNSRLVSIIGQKGSGKSALVELIAYTTGSWKMNESGSFMQRAKDHLKNTRIVVEWANGEKDIITLNNQHNEEQKIRYLSQKFVEQLCTEKGLGGSLVQEIESVIFSYLDPSDTMNASNFNELRTIRTKGMREERQWLRSEIDNLSHEEFTLRENESNLDEKRERINALVKKRKGLQEQIPAATSVEEIKILRNLQNKRRTLSKYQQESAQDKQTLQKIDDIEKRIESLETQMNRFYTKLKTQLKEIGLPNADIVPFQPKFTGDTEGPLMHLKAKLKKQIADRLGNRENPAEKTIRRLQIEIKKLEERQTADKAHQQKIKKMQTQISEINSEIKRIDKEVARITGPEKKRMEKAREERRNAYVKYFSNLKQEQETLKELYAPVADMLQSETASEHEQQLEFSVRWIVNIEDWLKRGVALFDRRRSLPYSNTENMTKVAREILVPAWTSGDATKVIPALEKFLEEFRKETYQPLEEHLRAEVTYMDVLRWMYEVEHISLSYGLRYNGTDLEKLSPGTKGIVLLILYLGIDVDDTRPLVVDQPDENLDNESIFQLLSGYFRTAKQRRQIILITHNPNLVVNTDSEQVIVAHAQPRNYGLPHIQYISGALENTIPDGNGIQQQVCRILEGGTDAFLKREQRYALEAQQN